MATIRSFTAFDTNDLGVGASVGDNETITLGAATARLTFITQDNTGDNLIEGDTGNNSTDPGANQIAFIRNGAGILVDGSEFYLDTSFTITGAGGTFTAYSFEDETTGNDIVVFPPNVPNGTYTTSNLNNNPAAIPYGRLSSGAENISESQFNNLDLSGADSIDAGAGNDTVNAAGGNDTIDGGSGNDSLVGGNGADSIFGDFGNDTIDGGAGADFLRGGDNNDSITGGAGADTIQGGGQSDTIDGGDNNDLIFGDVDNTGGTDGTALNLDFGNLVSDSSAGNNSAQIGDVAVYSNISTLTDGTPVSARIILDDRSASNLTVDLSGGTGFEILLNGTNDAAVDGQTATFRMEFFNTNTGDPVSLNAVATFNDIDLQTGSEAVSLQLSQYINFGVSANPATNLNVTTTPTTVVATGTQANGPADQAAWFSAEFAGRESIEFTLTSRAVNSGFSMNGDILDDPIIVPTVGDNDSILGGLGSDTIFGQDGGDTIDGQAGADSIDGGGSDDLIRLSDGHGNDTITGGELDETNGDTLDGGSLTQALNVQYTGDEAATFTNAVTGDAGNFAEIEHINTGSGNDTINGALDTVGIDLNAGAGDDTIRGGTAQDTLNAASGDDTIDGQGGADIINAGDGNDSIQLTGAFGADTITGGEGAEAGGDTLDGGALTENITVTYSGPEAGSFSGAAGGTATFSEIEAVSTGSGDDTIDASADGTGVRIDSGAGADSILGGAGGDTIAAGAGADRIDVGDGANLVGAGDGDDTILINDNFGTGLLVGGEGAETNGDILDGSGLTQSVNVVFSGDETGSIDNGAGGDDVDFAQIEAINTGSGDDTIDASNDTTGVEIDAGGGDDSITGGAGADSLSGGTGADTVRGAGADSLFGGAGPDLFLIDADTGTTVTVGDFDPSTNVDNNVIYDPDNLPDQTDNDVVDLSGFFANINELRDASSINGDGDLVLDLGDGQSVILVGVGDVNLLNFENTNVVCFTHGAMIRTPAGDVAVEDLAVGDLVETMDNGAQPIRWIGRRAISAGMLDATPRLRPVRIAKGVLGASRDLMVSPQHRMLVSGPKAEMLFGADEVLVSARDLIAFDQVHSEQTGDVEYFHILFDDHEIIFAEGVATESFHPGQQALSSTTARMQAEIFELFPELAADSASRPLARMVLKSHEAKALVG